MSNKKEAIKQILLNQGVKGPFPIVDQLIAACESTFIQDAVATESRDFEAIAARLSNPSTIRLLHGAMGLATEAGELVDQLKKHIFYGKELDLVNIEEETGDAMWYQAIILDELKKTFELTQDKIIAKLKARYPDRFSGEHALNRDLGKERRILEGNEQ